MTKLFGKPSALHHLNYHSSYFVVSHKREHPSLTAISADCEKCLDHSLNLCDTSRQLRDKHEQLANHFCQPELPTSTARTLVYELNGLSSAFLSGVSSLQWAIKGVQDDVEALSNVWKHVRGEPWWRKTLAWLRDGLAIAAAITMPIPEPHCQMAGVAFAAGSALSGFAYAQTAKYARRGRPIPYLPLIADALEGVSNNAEEIRSLELGLDRTILRALYLLDDADLRRQISRYVRVSHPLCFGLRFILLEKSQLNV